MGTRKWRLVGLLAILALTAAYCYETRARDQDLDAIVHTLGGYVEDDGRLVVLGGRHVTDDSLLYLRRLANLEDFSLADTRVTDQGLARIARHRALHSLDIMRSRMDGSGLVHLTAPLGLRSLAMNSTRITDDGLVRLEVFEQLESLDLCKNRISSLGLRHLAGMTRLRTLLLVGTDVDDLGLVHLKCLERLERLALDRTKVTAAGIADLRLALPSCEVSPD